MTRSKGGDKGTCEQEWMDVKITRLLGMGGPERGQAVEFSLGIESFAGTSHAGNSQVIHYLSFGLMQCSQRLYGLGAPKEAWVSCCVLGEGENGEFC